MHLHLRLRLRLRQRLRLRRELLGVALHGVHLRLLLCLRLLRLRGLELRQRLLLHGHLLQLLTWRSRLLCLPISKVVSGKILNSTSTSLVPCS